MERPEKLFENGPEWKLDGCWEWSVRILAIKCTLEYDLGDKWIAETCNTDDGIRGTLEHCLDWLRDRIRDNVHEGQRIIGEGWLPIELAPKDGTRVDLWWHGARRPDCEWIDEASHWWADSGFAITDPTHFRYIPKGPDQ